jgi:hypothetical protein
MQIDILIENILSEFQLNENDSPFGSPTIDIQSMNLYQATLKACVSKCPGSLFGKNKECVAKCKQEAAAKSLAFLKSKRPLCKKLPKEDWKGCYYMIDTLIMSLDGRIK